MNGYPTTGFFADNEGEFNIHKIEEFASKIGLKLMFGPAYSPLSNVINDMNHYSADVIMKKIIADDKIIPLEDSVSMALWTYNNNANQHGQTLLTLAT